MRISALDIRDAFFDELYRIAKMDPRVIFLTADMGAHSLRKFKQELKGQYINVGVAEQNMVSIAAGLTLGGRRVFIYTIIPFVSLRCYEQIKVNLCCMNLPVTIIGVGPGFCYGSDGPTHHATQDIAVMRALPEMAIFNPSDSTLASACARLAYKSCSPTYVRIDKGRLPLIYLEDNSDFSEGVSQLKSGTDLTIIATGIMVHRALEVAERLTFYSISAGVIDLYRIKPLNLKLLSNLIGPSKHVITLEENAMIGGIGSAVAEFLIDNAETVSLKRMAIPDQHCFESGTRELLHKFYNIDTQSIINTILKLVEDKRR